MDQYLSLFFRGLCELKEDGIRNVRVKDLVTFEFNLSAKLLSI